MGVSFGTVEEAASPQAIEPAPAPCQDAVAVSATLLGVSVEVTTSEGAVFSQTAAAVGDGGGAGAGDGPAAGAGEGDGVGVGAGDGVGAGAGDGVGAGAGDGVGAGPDCGVGAGPAPEAALQNAGPPT